MNNTENMQWENEFDKKFGPEGAGWYIGNKSRLCREIKSFIASAIETAVREERREISLTLGLLIKDWSPLPHNELRIQGWNAAIKSLNAAFSSRESSEAGSSCCEACEVEDKVRFLDCDRKCHCHTKAV